MNVFALPLLSKCNGDLLALYISTSRYGLRGGMDQTAKPRVQSTEYRVREMLMLHVARPIFKFVVYTYTV